MPLQNHALALPRELSKSLSQLLASPAVESGTTKEQSGRTAQESGGRRSCRHSGRHEHPRRTGASGKAPFFLKFPYGCLADHSTVGHDAEVRCTETGLEATDHRHDACGICRVARPHLAGKGAAPFVKQRPHDHLVQVRSDWSSTSSPRNAMAR